LKKSIAGAIHSFLFGTQITVDYKDEAGLEKAVIIPQSKGVR
jgi:hypothetical protein